MLGLFRLHVRPCPARVTFALPSVAYIRYHSRRSSSTTMASSSRNGRGYNHAVELLDSLQSNRAVVGSISSSSRNMNLDALPEMVEWTRKAGYNVEDFHNHGLRCIHVAGTKGKGSVCAMTENILLQYSSKDSVEKDGERRGLGKIGLYTSPHLIDVRERMRIDGIPVSEELFTQYFFQLWDRFSDAAGQSNDLDWQSATGKPGFFRFLTILAFHTFIEQGVETAIIECGIGGEYDSTNILPRDALTITAITKLGIDHVGMLGDTIEKIAWHKAGIMKTGVPAYTVPQAAEAQAVLQGRAAEKGTDLTVVERVASIESGDIILGLGGNFQVDNASLAVAVAASHLRTLGVTEDGTEVAPNLTHAPPEKFIQGLKTVLWPGRCQIINDGNIEWHIDGAHTTDSIIAAADWFSSNYLTTTQSSAPPEDMMLIFNQQDRDAVDLIMTLMNRLKSNADQHALKKKADDSNLDEQISANLLGPRVFKYVAFCTNDPFEETPSGAQSRDLTLQKQLASVYTSLDGNSSTMALQSIEETVAMARKVAQGHEKFIVFITGSLYLVGGLLKVLEKQRHDRAQTSK